MEGALEVSLSHLKETTDHGEARTCDFRHNGGRRIGAEFMTSKTHKLPCKHHEGSLWSVSSPIQGDSTPPPPLPKCAICYLIFELLWSREHSDSRCVKSMSRRNIFLCIRAPWTFKGRVQVWFSPDVHLQGWSHTSKNNLWDHKLHLSVFLTCHLPIKKNKKSAICGWNRTRDRGIVIIAHSNQSYRKSEMLHFLFEGIYETSLLSLLFKWSSCLRQIKIPTKIERREKG